MAIEKILFTTTFKQFAFNSLQTLIPLKNACLKEIILCNIIAPEEAGFVPFGGYLKEEEEKLREEARIRLDDWQGTLSEEGIRSRIVIEVGNPVSKLMHLAEKEAVDLIVVGKEEKKLIQNPLVSSTTMSILTRSRIPVLMRKYIVQYKINDEEMTRTNDHPFDSPMLVTDWSEQSYRALDLLSSLKGAVKNVSIFHDIDLETKQKLGEAELHALEEESRTKMGQHCTLLEDNSIACEFHLGAGEIAEEIVRVSRERQATMIIMGTTRKDKLHEMFQGSVSHEVARISELPTLLVP